MPIKNADKNETTSPHTGKVIGCFVDTISKISTNSETKMIGIDIKNENFATDFLSPPASRPALMVVPDLDNPGNIANPCAIPIEIAVLLLSLICLFFDKTSPKNKIAADNAKHTGNKLPEKDFLTNGKKIKAKTQVGKVARASEIVCFEKGCLIICQMSFAKQTMIEQSVAPCNKMLTNKLSLMPNNFENNTK